MYRPLERNLSSENFQLIKKYDQMFVQQFLAKVYRCRNLNALVTLTKHYDELLSKCISVLSAAESSDARYAINQLDQQLRLMGLRATIKIGIEKI